jgi:hypothetical protein
MATFVLVPGMCHGGWSFAELTERLRGHGHPLASLLQPLRLSGDSTGFRRDYVYAAGWDGPSPFTPVYQRLRADPAWTTHALDSGHNLMRDAPDELLKILLDAAGVPPVAGR